MRLINADRLESEMYHNAFEIDTDLQKWDSGCWIRYKMFENVIEEQPTVEAIPVEWIKQQLEKEEYRTFLVDYIEWRSCLDWLLEAWKEENEID